MRLGITPGAAAHPPAAIRRPQARAITLVAVSICAGVAVAVLIVAQLVPGMFAPDANTYLAAGERLNSGNSLYALSPGDRPIALNPPYWTVPFLSPPFLGVLWRPIALLGDDARTLWWAASLALLVLCAALLVARAPNRAAITLLLCAIPLALSVKFANVNGLLLVGALAVWWLWARGSVELATAVAILMVAVKLTPAPLVLWLLLLAPRRSLPAAVAVALGAAVISIVGSSPDDVAAYVEVIRNTVGPGVTDWSIPGIARQLGMGETVPLILPMIWVLASVALYATRSVPHVGYRVAIATWVFASPVVHTDSLVILLAMAAPSAWPSRDHGPAVSRPDPPEGPAVHRAALAGNAPDSTIRP